MTHPHTYQAINQANKKLVFAIIQLVFGPTHCKAMAPRKAAAVPAFVEADIIAIDAQYEADDEIPVEGGETEIAAGEVVRCYTYTNGTWVYKHSVKDDKEFDECKKSKVKGKKNDIGGTSSESETETKKKSKKNAKKVAESDTEPEHSDDEVKIPEKNESETKKKSKKNPKKVAASETEHSDDEVKIPEKKVPKSSKKASSSETSEAESDAPPITKKSRKGVTLDDVMESLTKLDINEAKTKLATFISKHGAEGKSKRTRKVALDENGEPIVRPQTAYSKFMSENLKRLNAEQKAKIDSGKLKAEDKVSPKNLLKEVSKLWQAQKTK